MPLGNRVEKLGVWERGRVCPSGGSEKRESGEKEWQGKVKNENREEGGLRLMIIRLTVLLHHFLISL